MTELDFEELDKAVNDLMQESTTVPAVQANDQQSVVNDGNAPDAMQPLIDSPKQEVAAMPLAIKRRGRFMDVVAPAGMKKPVLDGVVRRQGITIATPESQMQNTDSQPDVTQTDEIAGTKQAVDEVTTLHEIPAEADASVEPQVPEAESVSEPTTGYAPNPAPVHEWPETEEVEGDAGAESTQPIPAENAEDAGADENDANEHEIHVESSDDQEQAISVESGDRDDAAGEDSAAKSNDKNDEEQLVTVVAPDEARVSGDQSGDAASGLPESVMTSPFLPDAKVDKRPLGGGDTAGTDGEGQATAPVADMPREYSADLMSLDAKADEVVSGENAHETVAVSQAAPAPASTAALVAVGATAGAIFDTEAYHTPLKQPAKTKSVWHIVIWFLVLMIIGAIAGAAYFYLTMQR